MLVEDAPAQASALALCLPALKVEAPAPASVLVEFPMFDRTYIDYRLPKPRTTLTLARARMRQQKHAGRGAPEGTHTQPGGDLEDNATSHANYGVPSPPPSACTQWTRTHTTGAECVS